MAVSPVVLHPAEALQQTGNAKSVSSPLKHANSALASSNGTPLATTVVPSASTAAQSTILDLAEQLNEDEKRKWVKGKLDTITP
jgi:cyclin-dependent kinase 7